MNIDRHRAAWMAEGTFGVMVHWLVPTTAPVHGPHLRDLDAAVDRFDLDRFVEQFGETGADWLIFSIGQNSGMYASPNATLDGMAGAGHCSRRDLALEVAQRVTALGKRFIAYLPAEVENNVPAIQTGFGWDHTDPTQVVFQQRYCDFIRDYANKFGALLSGWWFDGCYPLGIGDFPNQYMDFAAFAAAARAGNADAVVAFNDGSFCVGLSAALSPEQDYLSGEGEVLWDGKLRCGREHDAPFIVPTARFVTGTSCQWHALVPIDGSAAALHWAHVEPGPMEPPLYDDENLFSFVRSCKAVGGAVTLNVAIAQEGHLGAETIAQLRRLHAGLS